MANVIREKDNFLPLINGVTFERLGRFSISAAVSQEVADTFLATPGYRLADEDEVPPHLAGIVLPASATLSGVVDQDGKQRDLADLRKDELVKVADGMGIDGFAKMTKPQLIAAIKKVELEPVADEPAPAAPAADAPDADSAPSDTAAAAAAAAQVVAVVGDEQSSEKSADEFF